MVLIPALPWSPAAASHCASVRVTKPWSSQVPVTVEGELSNVVVHSDDADAPDGMSMPPLKSSELHAATAVSCAAYS